MATEKTPKIKQEMLCENCDFMCSKKSDWERHILTNKHKKAENGVISNTSNIKNADFKENAEAFCCGICNHTYNSRTGLWRHKKKYANGECLQTKTQLMNIDKINTDMMNIDTADLKCLILEVVKNNSELQKQNQEFQKQMLEFCKKNNNINNNTVNSHNKTFNLQFFLNEQCKDAINIQDFVDSFNLQVEDLFRVGLEGYVEGISYIIIEKLKQMDIYKRPIHCSDARRDTMFVKHNNVWEKEGSDNTKLYKAIKDVGQKNFLMLNAFRELHPDCMESDSIYNDKYLTLLMKSAGCQKENVEKIIKKIAKEVLIQKD